MKKTGLLCAIAFSILCTKGFSRERPIVRDLQAVAGTGTRINVTWILPNDTEAPITRLFVYRTLKPVGSFYDISEEKPVATLSAPVSSYVDNVGDYRDYYYSVTCETRGSEFDIILPSINSTVNGVHLKLPEKKAETEASLSGKEKTYSVETLRDMPLPYLDLIESRNRTPLKMSDKALSIARELAMQTDVKKNYISEPHVFEEDLISPDSGDDFLLFEILRNYFIQKKYGQTINQLEKLIATNRTKSVTNRAKFYLGESYYFTKHYKEAAITFLSVYDEYPSLTKKWVDSALDMYEIPESEN